MVPRCAVSPYENRYPPASPSENRVASVRVCPLCPTVALRRRPLWLGGEDGRSPAFVHHVASRLCHHTVVTQGVSNTIAAPTLPPHSFPSQIPSAYAICPAPHCTAPQHRPPSTYLPPPHLNKSNHPAPVTSNAHVRAAHRSAASRHVPRHPSGGSMSCAMEASGRAAWRKHSCTSRPLGRTKWRCVPP
ncbi:hypothetical protein BDU57DRAFT_84369 [Ampelomyces quisqualis]|uniref:Uncharacterized protein n=1 Tax=Ampelomyces quisqualis TaxID=50730 RepID=A0A6A5Q8D6_AMPQU|nr:hypothetical protein BDU57DRAFT_84369 [Ampelomyces quisqualis]